MDDDDETESPPAGPLPVTVVKLEELTPELARELGLGELDEILAFADKVAAATRANRRRTVDQGGRSNNDGRPRTIR
jgi:hypothetical protein